ncbi:MAG: hypothetical protein HUU20_23885, partial [Pirellulales bacterium]|nr:hypothetical protein [Pirellulales bacterium]
MTADALFWLAIAGFLATCLAAVGARSLAEFSRHELEEFCRRRGSPDRFRQILRGYDQAALSAEMAQVIATVVCVGAMVSWFAYGGDASNWTPPALG